MTPVSLVVLCGPTGAGKTAAALALARAYKVGIINFDSRQVYRDFPILTAQPTPSEQACCPHRLYGFLDTGEKMTAGAFSELCRQAIDEFRSPGLLPVLVGGTGLYVRGLLDGLAPVPPVPEAISREVACEMERSGPAALHERLRGLDPEYAAVIHPNDRQRICRALEVCLATGKSFSWWHARPTPESPYRALRLGLTLPRERLTRRLAARIDQMLEQGALEEARLARQRCPQREAPGWSGIGCGELYDLLDGRLSLAEAKELWLRRTCQYAKRQMTWFAKDQDIAWYEADSPDIADRVLQRVRCFLESGPGRAD